MLGKKTPRNPLQKKKKKKSEARGLQCYEDESMQVLLITAQARINSANFLVPSGNIYLVWVPIAALADYHKLKTSQIDYLTGLKVESLHVSQWGQIKVSPCLCCFQEAAGKNPGFCPFLVLEAICIPWLVNPSLPTGLAPWFWGFCLPLLHLKDPCDFTGPTK